MGKSRIKPIQIIADRAIRVIAGANRATAMIRLREDRLDTKSVQVKIKHMGIQYTGMAKAYTHRIVQGATRISINQLDSLQLLYSKLILGLNMVGKIRTKNSSISNINPSKVALEDIKKQKKFKERVSQDFLLRLGRPKIGNHASPFREGIYFRAEELGAPKNPPVGQVYQHRGLRSAIRRYRYSRALLTRKWIVPKPSTYIDTQNTKTNINIKYPNRNCDSSLAITTMVHDNSETSNIAPSVNPESIPKYETAMSNKFLALYILSGQATPDKRTKVFLQGIKNNINKHPEFSSSWPIKDLLGYIAFMGEKLPIKSNINCRVETHENYLELAEKYTTNQFKVTVFFLTFCIFPERTTKSELTATKTLVEYFSHADFTQPNSISKVKKARERFSMRNMILVSKDDSPKCKKMLKLM
ncbi:hypothetical protein BB561_003641 [Smittium simulii]|uniref:Uncharacterized protein n=1 Tax=Smittium simulii TaxID=133385 RepID=A0A2T9YK56_9FUNG|nr:hypothetical protein BB561_003641 [Smittium simulii]